MVMLMMPLMVLEEGMTTRVLKFVETNFYSRMIMTTTTTKTTDAQPRINEQTNNRTNDRTNGWTERTKNTRILDGTRLLDEVLGTHGRNCTSPYSKTQNTHTTHNQRQVGRSLKLCFPTVRSCIPAQHFKPISTLHGQHSSQLSSNSR